MRIALISDIHYGKSATTNELAIDGEPLALGEVQNAKPLLQGMTEILKAEKPNYLFIAGDLTSTGSPLEFKYCYQKMLKLGSDIGIEPSHIVFCLGNHDVDWRITKAMDTYIQKKDAEYPDGDIAYLRDFYQKLAYSVPVQIEDPAIQPLSYNEVFTAPFTGVVEYDDCIVFILNSSYMGAHDQKYKRGQLSTDQLQWFESVAQKYKDHEKLKVTLLHHHPFNYPYPLPALDISTLEEGGELSEICGKNGIDLVLHGHRHQPQAKTQYVNGWTKPVTYICAGSLSVNATDRHQIIPNTFHLINYQGPEEIILKNYSYTTIDGWLPASYDKRTPIDGTMWLGKMVYPESAEIMIRELPKNQNIKYQSLNPELRYFPVNKLMELVREVHKDFVVYNNFPDDIMIFSHGEVQHA